MHSDFRKEGRVTLAKYAYSKFSMESSYRRSGTFDEMFEYAVKHDKLKIVKWMWYDGIASDGACSGPHERAFVGRWLDAHRNKWNKNHK
jgi:hypothetical protein